MKKLLVPCLFILATSALAGDPTRIRFEYSPNEGEGLLECTHVALRQWDWDVTCGAKKFYAHLVLSEMHRERKPQTYLEILYHVMAYQGDHAFTSQASWIFLSEKSSTYNIGLSQGIENGQASLKVEAEFEHPLRF